MDDRFVEDILQNDKKKKKVNGKQKGNRTELNLCKMLTKHFGEEFSRAPGSGARTSQIQYLPEHAKKTLTGDICVPEGFKWVIECKGGYEDDMNLVNVCDGNVARLDEFIEQVTKDAEYCGRQPLILWKRNRKPWIAIVKHQDYVKDPCDNFIRYGDWVILNFEFLLENTKKRFWFEKKNSSD